MGYSKDLLYNRLGKFIEENKMFKRYSDVSYKNDKQKATYIQAIADNDVNITDLQKTLSQWVLSNDELDTVRKALQLSISVSTDEVHDAKTAILYSKVVAEKMKRM